MNIKEFEVNHDLCTIPNMMCASNLLALCTVIVNKTGYFLLFLLMIGLPALSQNQAMSDLEVERMLKKMELDIASQLPLGNQLSMVISAYAGPGRLFTYSSVQTIPAREWTSGMKNHSKQIAVNDYCTNPNLSVFKKQRVTVSWVMSDLEGQHVLINTVSPALCR